MHRFCQTLHFFILFKYPAMDFSPPPPNCKISVKLEPPMMLADLWFGGTIMQMCLKPFVLQTETSKKRNAFKTVTDGWRHSNNLTMHYGTVSFLPSLRYITVAIEFYPQAVRRLNIHKYCCIFSVLLTAV